SKRPVSEKYSPTPTPALAAASASTDLRVTVFTRASRDHREGALGAGEGLLVLPLEDAELAPRVGEGTLRVLEDRVVFGAARRAPASHRAGKIVAVEHVKELPGVGLEPAAHHQREPGAEVTTKLGVAAREIRGEARADEELLGQGAVARPPPPF